MVVRRLKARDEIVACKAVAKFKNSHPTAEYMARFLSNKTNYLYVAEVEGELAGFLLAYKLERCDGERAMMFLYEVEVLSQYRRQGIGGALVEAVRRECEQGGFLKLFVLTDESNEPAKQLYLSAEGRREDRDAVLFHFFGGGSGQGGEDGAPEGVEV